MNPAVNLEKGMLSEMEAASWLGVSRITLLRKRMAGRVGFYRIGVRVLYSVDAHLRPFLESCERKPRSTREGVKHEKAGPSA